MLVAETRENGRVVRIWDTPSGPQQRIHGTIAERFWPKVDRRGPGECWPWLALARNGYGKFRYGSRCLGAHRVAYELTHGPIPPGLDCLHHCDNPLCCNPAHLFLGTDIENQTDCRRKGRMPSRKGIRQPHRVRLSPNDRAAIRWMRRQGIGVTVLCKLYGTSRVNVWKIARAALSARGC